MIWFSYGLVGISTRCINELSHRCNEKNNVNSISMKKMYMILNIGKLTIQMLQK